MTDVTTTVDLKLQPWQSRAWLNAINMALPDLIQAEHSSQRTEDTLVVQVQWPLLQSMTDPTALSVPNAPIANVLIASQ